ncbi:MAG: TolC family protein [Deltaproteobacteria bacterium]|nr:TolC family protein [Deltaproteobacteria bacterium]
MPLLHGAKTVLIFFIATAISGCAATDFKQVRREQHKQFLHALDARTGAAMADNATLSLEDCIGIALKQNLELQSARINQHIAGLERTIAFSGFLPRADIAVSQHRSRYRPEAYMGQYMVPLADQSIRQTTLSLQQPVFDPYTWFVYRIFQNGEAIRELVTLRTRQRITLNITALFYQYLSLEAAGEFLAASLQQAQAVHDEVIKAHQYEIARSADVADAVTLVTARRYQLSQNRRNLRQSRSELLEAMGLHPLRTLNISVSKKIISEPGALVELIMSALLARPEMSILDRRYAIEQDKAKLAITRFLPVLSAVGSLSHTTDSIVKYQTQWLGGLNGVMSLFSGFADINTYRAARAQAEKAFVKREQAGLMVMLQVQQAWLNLESAAELQVVSKNMLRARKERLREQNALWQEGLIQHSERLEALAKRDEARMQHSINEYRYQIAQATLLDVTGQGLE